jgi:hypothetical protein
VLSRLCPNCGEWLEPPALCPNGCLRSDGRVVDERRLALEAVWQSERWRRLSRRVRARDGACVDCGAIADLVADHVEGFDGPDDPRAWDPSLIVTRCRSCSGAKDGGRRRSL